MNEGQILISMILMLVALTVGLNIVVGVVTGG